MDDLTKSIKTGKSDWEKYTKKIILKEDTDQMGGSDISPDASAKYGFDKTKAQRLETATERDRELYAGDWFKKFRKENIIKLKKPIIGETIKKIRKIKFLRDSDEGTFPELLTELIGEISAEREKLLPALNKAIKDFNAMIDLPTSKTEGYDRMKAFMRPVQSMEEFENQRLNIMGQYGSLAPYFIDYIEKNNLNEAPSSEEYFDRLKADYSQYKMKQNPETKMFEIINSDGKVVQVIRDADKAAENLRKRNEGEGSRKGRGSLFDKAVEYFKTILVIEQKSQLYDAMIKVFKNKLIRSKKYEKEKDKEEFVIIDDSDFAELFGDGEDYTGTISGGLGKPLVPAVAAKQAEKPDLEPKEPALEPEEPELVQESRLSPGPGKIMNPEDKPKEEKDASDIKRDRKEDLNKAWKKYSEAHKSDKNTATPDKFTLLMG